MNRFLRHRHLWFPGASVLVVLTIGLWAAHWRAESVDRQLRQQLVSQASHIAQTIHPDSVRSLSFTAADADNPDFIRLRRQMSAYARAAGHRSLYSVARRGSELVFGPESLPQDHPWASPPGTVFEQPSPALVSSFDVPRAFAEGPVRDEYGTFVSALAPITEPITGEVLMMVGLDEDAGHWQARINRERLLVAGLAMAIASILIVGGAILHWREAGGGIRRRRWHPAEAALAGIVGLAITATLTWAVHDAEQDRRRQALVQAAQSQVQRARDLLARVQDFQLGGISRLYASSEEVTPAEFLQYALHLIHNGDVRALGWVEAAAPLNLARFVEDRDGSTRAPLSLDPDSVHGTAVVQAIQSTLDSISLTPAPLNGGDDPALILLARPLPYPGVTREPRGAAIALITPESLLGHQPPYLEPNPPLMAALHHLGTDGTQSRLVCAPDCPDGSPASLIFPLFIHGEAFALELGPGPAFLDANPLRGAWITGAAGLLLTSSMVAFVTLLNRRRADLERLVRARTVALTASETRLRDSEQRQQLALAGADLGLWDWHIPSGRLTFNERWAEMLGRRTEDIAPSIDGWLSLVHPEDIELLQSALDAHFRGETPRFESEHRLRHHEGHWVWVLSRGKVMELGADGEPLRAVGTHLDISARKAAEAELRHLADFDPLTELPNRRNFLDVLGQEIERFRRFCQPAALLMLDLDKFKQVNDNHGHAAGDRVLKHFAALIRASLRKTDQAGRLGGEEFAILLPGSDEDGAMQFAERLRQRTAGNVMDVMNQAPIQITVSIGVTLIAGHDNSPDDPLARCDRALYRAKAAGRDQVELEHA